MSRLRRTAAALAVALATVLVAPLTAHAVGYQFWGYYQLAEGEWGFAVEGLATTVPEDGAVHGLRFAVSSGDDMRTPRDVLEFDEVCGDVPTEDGSKRVALVIDPGRDVDAPEGETPLSPGAQCVVADSDATTLDVLRVAVPDLRTDEANMLCGLAGFPESACSDEIADPTPEQLAEDDQIEIPVVPDGTPIVAPPTAEPTDEPTEDPTEDPTATEGATEEETTSADATEGAPTEATTEDPAESASDEATAEETTDGATSEEATSEDDAQATPSETPDEATAEEDSSDGIPSWAWVVGIVALVGILGAVATNARNRRLEAAQGAAYDDAPADGPDGQFPDGQDEQFRDREDDQFPDGQDDQFPDDRDGR